ncbi:YhjD/YihY/BrkB family envelope integrity protein [Streptomyces venezuelae ATCC 10712]
MSWATRVRDLRAGAERRFPVITELTSRLVSGNLLDAATRLAAQAFLAAVPLLFALAAFAPSGVRDQMLESLRTVFGLRGSSDEQLRQVLQGSADPGVRETSGAVGALVALVSATSFSRAMARVCERAWRLPKAGTRIAAWRWAVWLLALVLVVLLQAPCGTASARAPGWAFRCTSWSAPGSGCGPSTCCSPSGSAGCPCCPAPSWRAPRRPS